MPIDQATRPKPEEPRWSGDAGGTQPDRREATACYGEPGEDHLVLREVQADGRIRFWVYVPELGRHLRVVTLDDGETVHNAFPDRSFGEATP